MPAALGRDARLSSALHRADRQRGRKRSANDPEQPLPFQDILAGFIGMPGTGSEPKQVRRWELSVHRRWLPWSASCSRI